MPEYDSPWKELLELFFEWFLLFFFPDTHAQIDWTRGYESLDKELRKVLPEAEVGTLLSDALMKAWTAEGDVRYVHLEVQCQWEHDFPGRMNRYNSIFEVLLNNPVLSHALLGDRNPVWRPSCYLFEIARFRKVITFPMAKILDYRGREAELEAHANPIALVTAAHLLTLTTKREDPERQVGKLRLLKNVIDRKMTDVEHTFHFKRLIDWIVDLPPAGQAQV